MLLVQRNKRWKRLRISLVFLKISFILNKIMMFSIHGSVLDCSLSLHSSGLILNTRISSHSSPIKCYKQERTFYSFGSQEWSCCHSGLLTRLHSMKFYCILWYVIVRETRCQNQEVTLLIHYKLSKAQVSIT